MGFWPKASQCATVAHPRGFLFPFDGHQFLQKQNQLLEDKNSSWVQCTALKHIRMFEISWNHPPWLHDYQVVVKPQHVQNRNDITSDHLTKYKCKLKNHVVEATRTRTNQYDHISLKISQISHIRWYIRWYYPFIETTSPQFQRPLGASARWKSKRLILVKDRSGSTPVRQVQHRAPFLGGDIIGICLGLR